MATLGSGDGFLGSTDPYSIGAYGFFVARDRVTGGALIYNPGETIAGSQLRFATIRANYSTGAIVPNEFVTAPSGTWKIMSRIFSSDFYDASFCVCLRIS